MEGPNQKGGRRSTQREQGAAHMKEGKWPNSREKIAGAATVSRLFFVYLIQSEVIYLTVNRLTRIRVRCGQRIRN